MENKRTIKNIIIIVVILLSLTAMIITGYYTVKNNTTTNNNIQENANNNQGEPPEKPSGEMGEPPEKPSGEMGEPPEKPDGENAEPPEKPEENAEEKSSSSEESKAPSMGSDALDEEKNTTEEQETKQEDTKQEETKQEETKVEQKSNIIIPTSFYIIFGLEALIFSICLVYLIESKMNSKDFQDTFLDGDKITIFILSTIILTSLLVFGGTKIINNVFPSTKDDIVIEDKTNPKSNEQGTKPGENTSQDVEAASASTIIDDKKVTGSYESKNANENVILVKNGGNATLNDITLTKSGDTTNNENSDFYGINAALLVQKDSTATIKGATINTSAKGANAVFASGENAKIYISDSKIETTGNNSARGLDATYGGYIEADNVTISTLG